MNEGFIALVKARYRAAKMEQAIDWIEEAVSDIYKKGILSAIYALRRVWNELPGEIIKNFWRHTKLFPKNWNLKSWRNNKTVLASHEVVPCEWWLTVFQYYKVHDGC